MAASVSKARLIYDPATSPSTQGARMAQYSHWLSAIYSESFSGYPALWRWSVEHPSEFWLSIAEFFEIEMGGEFDTNAVPTTMPGGQWFPGATLNFADAALRRRGKDAAILYRREDGSERELHWDELTEQVGRLAAGLRSLGVGKGDRVAAYLPNTPEAVIGLLACASLGAIWSLCSPDFGAKIVVDRFGQIEPCVLIASSEYVYGGKQFDRSEVIADIAGAIPALQHVVHVGDRDLTVPGCKVTRWTGLIDTDDAIGCRESVDFNHPLWIVYTSGTTGLPKPIVHSHGGAALELAKLNGLHLDLGANDRFFWYSSTGWIMWNIQIGGLLAGAAIALYDGNPNSPDANSLWRFVAEKRLTYFGAGAQLFQAAQHAGLEPGRDFDLSALRAVGSTGSPLPASTFEWLADSVKAKIPIDSICGGTDVTTAILGPCRLLPLYAGELQCRCLGAKLAAYNDRGRAVVDALGELVIETPMPSMPLYLWGDRDDARYRAAYFERFDGVWSQGDWVQFLPHGACVVYGRSDATLNRGGVRLGTAEFYSVVEGFDWVVDSLVVDTSELGRAGELILFLKVTDPARLEQGGRDEINAALASQLSPRHRPDRIVLLDEIPRTLTGKKLEVPVKKLVNGASLRDAVNPSTVDHPAILETIATLFATDATS